MGYVALFISPDGERKKAWVVQPYGFLTILYSRVAMWICPHDGDPKKAGVM